jgi:hypothetical protein
MPTKNKAITETVMENNGEELQEQSKFVLSNGVPVVQCAVNRRINVGNYEHVDLLIALTVPVDMDKDKWGDMISVSISEAMRTVSTETNQRYQAIKEAQGDGRPATN